MTDGPAAPVTVVCATRNARPAVRLTFASFFRHNVGPWPVFVADNGSTDGTLDELRCWSQIRVLSLAQRTALMQREAAFGQQVIDRLALRDSGLARRYGHGSPTWDATTAGDVTEHGATLDWLVARVTTPFVLVLDSDVEFLAGGLVEDMLAHARRAGLAALGVYEDGHAGYRPRLAPYVLLLNTDVVRRLGVSFRGGSITTDPEEARRWQARPRRYQLDLADLDDYPTTRVYATGAYLFERLGAAGETWADLPPELSERFHHYGHLSWGGLGDLEGGSDAARREHAARLAAVERALTAYSR